MTLIKIQRAIWLLKCRVNKLELTLAKVAKRN